MVLLQQMGILFVYMMIGYVACKKEYFDIRNFSGQHRVIEHF